MNNEVMIMDQPVEVQLNVARDPKQVLAEAQLVSGHLARYADKHGLYKLIGQSKHLMIEGWLMVATCYRVTARTVETRFVDMGGGVRGFEAVAEAIHVPTGRVVGRGDAMCLNDEDNWSTRPKYEWRGKEKVKVGDVPVPLQQLRSMAQTRAQSKVLASVFRWVAKFGGFSGTPGEEMTGNEDQGPQRPGSRSGQSAPAQEQSDADVISEAQAKRMYAIGKNAQLSEDEYKAVLAWFGYGHSKKVRKADYDRICEALSRKPDPDAITADQAQAIIEAAENVGLTPDEFEAVLKTAGVKNVQDLKKAQFEAVLGAVKKGGAK